jgi:hypothetical protein
MLGSIMKQIRLSEPEILPWNINIFKASAALIRPAIGQSTAARA